MRPGSAVPAAGRVPGTCVHGRRHLQQRPCQLDRQPATPDRSHRFADRQRLRTATRAPKGQDRNRL